MHYICISREIEPFNNYTLSITMVYDLIGRWKARLDLLL